MATNFKEPNIMKVNRNKALSAKKGRLIGSVVQVALGIVMLLFGSATTWAADMCLLDEEGLAVTVGKNFSFPAAGACKAFHGYMLDTSGCILSGTACGTSDNAQIRLHLTHSCTGNAVGIFGTASYHIDRFNSDLRFAGFGYYCQSSPSNRSSWACAQNHIRTIPCPSPHPVN